MSYIRITFEKYIEGDYEYEEDAVADFLDMTNELTEDDLTITRFNEDTGQWE